jgi:predicted metal-dependent peptidase
VDWLWSPDYFLKLLPGPRKTEVKHELWHVARLHGPRRGNRCPKLWNIACDIINDIGLLDEGCDFTGIDGVLSWPNLNALQYRGQCEEQVYDHLHTNGFPTPMDYKPDLLEGDPNQQATIVNIVVRAMQQAKMQGAGSMPGDLEQIITKFLTPIVPWEILFHRFMQNLVQSGYTWRKPNRRHTKIYLPSVGLEEGALTHLAYIEDTSGSISDEDSLRFNSEVKYVKEEYKPEKMTLLQFDTIIQDERVYLEDDPFEQIVIKGRGGTDLEPVRQWIIANRPTAAVIFSDLCCAPMGPLPFDIPVIWVAIGNKSAEVPYGQLIHIK